MTTPTNAENFVGELNAGVFAKQLGHVLSDVAESVATNGKKGEVTIKLRFAPSKADNQVEMECDLSYKAPKASRGHRAELTPSDTLMYVNKGGRLSSYPENQHDLFANHTAAE